jgi:hypothetical protein
MNYLDESEIAKRSYLIWETEGRPDGKALDHWLRAKAALESEAAPGASAPPNRARAGAAPRKPRSTSGARTAKAGKAPVA